ncbi:FAD:protein FMN transferase [Aestuariibacter salexigens]|uniref:FAD:protein FMN transferase n=1 Tax=Aestuariibacter salexigens TaxID=226010 RepID=UPI0004245CA0|nr:FAD:protein FMN transferase [Aestuariibacter salexigens]
MRIGFICILGALAVLAWPCHSKWFVASEGIMGTNIHTEIWSEDEALGQKAVKLVMGEMERINQLMSPYIDTSELSRINALAAREDVIISDEMFALLSLSTELSERSNGAFDITFASVGFLYDYRNRIKPSDADIEQKLEAIDYRLVELDAHTKSVRFFHKDVKIDLGGIAKGHAVDNAIALLEKNAIQHALVTAGGDTRLLGDRNGKPWIVGIRDPRDREKQAVVVPLENTAMSTSGDYERYFEQDGQRYHHILSPSSGKSTHSVQSVSIIGPSATINDGLSTAVFVLGLEDGMALIERMPGYDAIIMDNNRSMHFSSGLADH